MITARAKTPRRKGAGGKQEQRSCFAVFSGVPPPASHRRHLQAFFLRLCAFVRAFPTRAHLAKPTAPVTRGWRPLAGRGGPQYIIRRFDAELPLTTPWASGGSIMRRNVSSVGVRLTVFTFVTAVAVAARTGQPGNREGFRGTSSTGLVPLCQMGEGQTYKGQNGGLYGQGRK